MNISQRCQYALRAVFELAKRKGDRPTTVGEIAAHQAIPVQFLEIILMQLRQAGVVDSRRGVKGGYVLKISPQELTIGHIVRQMDGDLEPVKCLSGGTDCPLRGKCVFKCVWEQARDAVTNVYDHITLQDLVTREAVAQQVSCACDYNI